MSNVIKDIEIINDTYYYLFVEIINKKILIQNNFKIDENPYKKYSYLLEWICNNERFEIHKN